MITNAPTESSGTFSCTDCSGEVSNVAGSAVQPCSPRGARTQLVQITSGMTAGASLTGNAEAVYDRTGRSFAGDTPSAMLDHEAWSKSATRDQIRSNPLAQRFSASLVDVPLLAGPVTCFRAFVHLVEGKQPELADTGPPPTSKCSPGRYNNRGAPVLYLGDSLEAVRAEVPTGGNPRWVQRYVLPVALRIGDFSKLDPKHPASQTLWFAEFANRDARDAQGYLFSQVIAEIVRSKFQGIHVPGTRGRRGVQYCNVVIFDHSPWTDWLSGPPFLDEEAEAASSGLR